MEQGSKLDRFTRKNEKILVLYLLPTRTQVFWAARLKSKELK